MPKPKHRPEVMRWLEKMANSKENKDKTIDFLIPERKNRYTIREIVDEIRKRTPFGNSQYRVTCKLYDYLRSEKYD